MANILSLLATLLRGVNQIDGTGRPGGKGACLEILVISILASIVLTLRLGTID